MLYILAHGEFPVSEDQRYEATERVINLQNQAIYRTLVIMGTKSGDERTIWIILGRTITTASSDTLF